MYAKYPSPYLWIAGVLTVCLAATAWFTWRQFVANEAAAVEAVAAAAQRVATDVTERINLYQYGIRGARGAILTAGEDGTTNALFQRYSASRDVDVEFPGASGFGFIRRVAPEDEAAFVAAQHADGRPDFRVRQLSPHEGERYIIQYIEPIGRNAPAVGLDIASEANRREAADRAMRSGSTSLTGPIILVQRPDSQQRSFLLLMPVYRPGPAPLTDEERQARTFGWAYAPLSMSEVLAPMRFDSSALHFLLRDVTRRDDEQTIYETVEEEADPLFFTQRLERIVFGRRWVIEVSARQAFIDGLNLTQPRTVAIIGVLASLLLAALAGAESVGRRRKAVFAARMADFNADLERQVIERTRELNRVNSLVRDVLRAASEVSIIATDRDGVIQIFNDGAQRMLGYTAAEMVGVQTPAIIHVPAEVAARGAVLSAEYGMPIEGFRVFVHKAELGVAETREWTYVRKDGSHLDVSLVVTAMRDDLGNIIGFLGIAEDITEQRQATAALRQAKTTAEAANAAKSRFLAIMSHELRTPMAGVLGMGELLLKSGLADEQKALAQQLMRSARALLDLLDDILDFAKIEAEKVELDDYDFSVRQVVADVCSVIAPLASDSGNTVLTDIDPSLAPAYRGDGKRYRQILMNLVGNANKFTQKGHITIAVRRMSSDDDATVVETRVTDTGVGIADENKERLFQPFVQEDTSTSRRFGGTGLGLAICKTLSELMGGQIWVESRKGEGSTFGFTVRLRDGDQKNIEATDLPHVVRAAHEQSLRILVAEDNDTNRTLAVRMLANYGHVVIAVENGAEAVAAFEADSFDVILMDMQMPVMDGPAAMGAIRSNTQRGAQIPMIALTADAVREHHDEYLAAGANAVLTKPVDWAFLNAEMARLTERQVLQPSPMPVESPDTAAAVFNCNLLNELHAVLGEGAVAAFVDKGAVELRSLVEKLAHMTLDDGTDAMRRTAHAMKGLAAQLGAVRVSALASDAEKAAKSGTDISDRTPDLSAAADEALAAIREWRAGKGI